MASKISALALSLILGIAFVPCSLADDPPAASGGDAQAGAPSSPKQGSGRRFGKRFRKRMGQMRHRKRNKEQAPPGSSAQGNGGGAAPQSN